MNSAILFKVCKKLVNTHNYKVGGLELENPEAGTHILQFTKVYDKV